MEKPIAVLHLIAGASHGGAETFCLDTILGLKERGIRQKVICRPHAHFIKTLADHDIPFVTFGFKKLDRFGARRGLIRKTVAEFRPSLVHAWMGRAASFVPRGLKVPVVGWFGGYYDLKRYRRCGHYIGVTRQIVEHIRKRSGWPDRAHLVHTFGTLAPAPAVERSTFQTPDDAPVVLMLSRMHEKKGVDLMLRAAVQLPGVYLWLAGDGPEKERYEALAKELGLEDRVRFLGWRTDRAALLSAATICALPSRYEPFGTVIAEAWSMRVPLVAAMADGASQYVRAGVDGLLFPVDDVDALAACVRSLVADPALGQKIAAEGYKAYEETFSRSVVLDRMIEVYGKISGSVGTRVRADRDFKWKKA